MTIAEKAICMRCDSFKIQETSRNYPRRTHHLIEARVSASLGWKMPTPPWKFVTLADRFSVFGSAAISSKRKERQNTNFYSFLSTFYRNFFFGHECRIAMWKTWLISLLWRAAVFKNGQNTLANVTLWHFVIWRIISTGIQTRSKICMKLNLISLLIFKHCAQPTLFFARITSRRRKWQNYQDFKKSKKPYWARLSTF